MKIVLANDHGALNLKNLVKEHLQKKGIEVIDIGCNSTESVDYPDFGEKAALMVSNKEVDLGMLFCGTGIGISLAANKVANIRCAVVTDTFSAKMSRAHNNANMLALGERVVGFGLALELVDAFLNTEFEGDRHQRRVDKLMKIEAKYKK